MLFITIYKQKIFKLWVKRQEVAPPERIGDSVRTSVSSLTRSINFANCLLKKSNRSEASAFMPPRMSWSRSFLQSRVDDGVREELGDVELGVGPNPPFLPSEASEPQTTFPQAALENSPDKAPCASRQKARSRVAPVAGRRPMAPRVTQRLREMVAAAESVRPTRRPHAPTVAWNLQQPSLLL
jgi:hypothetical protein